MNPVLSILRTAHCRSTHHYFAIDAIALVQTEAGKRLISQLLYHHDRYLTGAKDPDIRFRDFQNHVVHVTDGYWGGAPRVAHIWYDRMQRYLRTDRFGDAAHAAGVLSHYFTDPFQPLHTQQCDREKILHRPIEWSITKSYHDIYRRWKQNELRIVFQLSGGPSWLGEAILHGARFANRKYWSLIENYDLDRGAKHAPAGLNDELRESLAELFGLSITGLRACWRERRLTLRQLDNHRFQLPGNRYRYSWHLYEFQPDCGSGMWWTNMSDWLSKH